MTYSASSGTLKFNVFSVVAWIVCSTSEQSVCVLIARRHGREQEDWGATQEKKLPGFVLQTDRLQHHQDQVCHRHVQVLHEGIITLTHSFYSILCLDSNQLPQEDLEINLDQGSREKYWKYLGNLSDDSSSFTHMMIFLGICSTFPYSIDPCLFPDLFIK